MQKCLTDRRKSISLFLLLFVAYALIYMTKNCYAAAMASIVDEGVMTKSETGLIAAAFYLIYAPFQIVGGIAADRYSPAKLILFGLVGAGVCNLLVYFFSGNYIAMLIIWSLNAVAQFGVWPAVFKLVATQLKAEHRMGGVFYINFSASLGLALSYAIAVFITDWRMNFFISAVTLFLSSAVFWFLYHGLERHMTSCVVAEIPVKSEAAVKSCAKKNFALIVGAGIPLLMIVNANVGLLNLGLKALVPIMLVESYESVSPALGNALNILLVLAGPVGLFLAKLPIFKRFNDSVSITGLFVLLLPFLVVITLVGRIGIVFIVGALVILMMLISAASVFFGYISRVFERFGCSGTVAGMINCMAALGVVLANYVFARVAELFGWGVATASWLVLGAVAVFLMLIFVPIWKRFEKKI